jgi:hypothetical protein
VSLRLRVGVGERRGELDPPCAAAHMGRMRNRHVLLPVSRGATVALRFCLGSVGGVIHRLGRIVGPIDVHDG